MIYHMVYAQVYIEHSTLSLSKLYTYASPFYTAPGCRVLVPFGNQKLTGMVWSTSKNLPQDLEGKAVKEIIRVEDETPVFNEELRRLAEQIAYDNITSVMHAVKMMLPQMKGLGKSRKKAVMEEWFDQGPASPESVKMTPLQKEVLQSLLLPCKAKEARKLFSPSVLKALVQKRVLCIQEKTKSFLPYDSSNQKPWPKLNAMQKNALEVIRSSDNRTVLLHGVTGAGKTEVFFHLMKEALEKNKQVLLMVPEISLTPMMISRVQSRFQEPVFACHSKLSSAEHLDLWQTVQNNKPCIVIGTRKAVFLPFSNPGIIIMDEEHDGSYKQDCAPRYHVRDAALFRSKYHNCPLILASATPSLDSYARALKGIYTLAELPSRAAGSNASVRILDLKKNQTVFNMAKPVLEAIADRLRHKEKSLLLLNRRGYLPTVHCTSCKEFLLCEDCMLPLSFHKKENALVCHVCGARYPVIHTCPACGRQSLSTTGQGTERLEDELSALFPSASIVRMDADTTRRKNAHRHLLEKFDHEGDILTGTQMISKGLDFEKITLAAVLSVDAMLSRPDYYACEQAYQLIEQTAGRAGRGKYAGEVFVQTFNPDHYVLHYVQMHDYRGFFMQEMRYRRAGMYPPYVFLASVVFISSSQQNAWDQALQAARAFRHHGLEVLGPADISMRRQMHRVRLLCKSRDDEQLKASLWKFARWFENNKNGTSAEINVHPLMLEV